MSETAEIPLNGGFVAIVDSEDFEELSKYKWYCNHGYARRAIHDSLGKQIIITIHGQILGHKDGFEIDHINGDRLDNRKCNLRHVTHAQNIYNKTVEKGGSSKYKGVHWCKKEKKWISQTRASGKKYRIGSFDSEVDAATSYNTEALKNFGEYARLNIIQGGV